MPHPLSLLKAYYLEFVFILLSILLRIPSLIYEPPMWDETFSWVITQNSYIDIFRVTAHDTHPPFYYLLLKLWIYILGDNLITLRLLSLLAWAIAFFGMIVIVRKLNLAFPIKILIYDLLVIVPAGVRLATLTRMYAVDAALVIWALVVFYYYSVGVKLRSLTTFSGLILLALYTLNTSFFVWIGVNVYFVLSKIYSCIKFRKPMSSIINPSNRLYVISQLVVAALYLPWALVVLQQMAGPATRQLAWSPLLDLKSLFLSFGFLLGVDENNQLGSYFLLAGESLIVLYLIFQKLTSKNTQPVKLELPENRLFYLLVVVVVSTFGSLLLLFTRQPAIAARSFSLATFCFLLVLSKITPMKNNRTATGFSLIIGIFLTGGMLFSFVVNYRGLEGEKNLARFFEVINQDKNTALVMVRQQGHYPIAYQQVKYMTRQNPKLVVLDAETDTGDYIIYDREDFLEVRRLPELTSSFYYVNFLDSHTCQDITSFALVYRDSFEELGRKAELCKYQQPLLP